jgi:hypothetical protein
LVKACERAGVIENFENVNEKQIYSAIHNKWLSTNSIVTLILF